MSRGERVLRWPTLLILASTGLAAAASADPKPSAPARAEALPPLPATPRLELPKPTADALEEVDRLLARLVSAQLEQRDAAARELLEAKAQLVPAIAFRIHGIADRADKEAMKRMFSDIRDKARDEARRENKASGGSQKVETPDYLAMLVQYARPGSQPFEDLVRVVAMSRMLTQIGTVEAVRALIDVYVRFGEFLRIHTQRELAALGDRAVPALLEARRHPAEKISSWARRQLDTLGRAVPSEAVQTTDHSVLADVLRAYGRLKDPDAARIIVSFANSERAVVREGARQAIVLMGEVAAWQLRDSYETTVGKRPPRDWSWDRTARELFAELDRMRSASVLDAYDRGRTAHARNDLEAMRQAYDEVLAKDPAFDKRDELARGYLEYAESIKEQRPDDAAQAVFRALRLSAGSQDANKLESELLWLRARSEIERGVLDTTLLRRALELDPNNAKAREALERLRTAEPDKKTSMTRKLAASTVAVGALAALFVLLRRRPEPEAAAQPAHTKPPSAQPLTEPSEAAQRASEQPATTESTAGAPAPPQKPQA